MPVVPVESQVRRWYWTTNAIAHAAFIPTGMITVMLGPLLPTLSSRWSLDDTQAGYLISAQFLGALIGTVGSGLIIPRAGFCRTITAGQILMALGTASLLWLKFYGGATAILVYGLGTGLTVPTGNLLVAANTERHRSSTLSLLNLCWSVGAVSCPFLLAAFQSIGRAQILFYGIAGYLVVLTILMIAISSEEESVSRRAVPANQRADWIDYWRDPAAIMLGLLFFVYVGSESALGVWLASYAKRAGTASAMLWMSVPSYFYGALLLGRALAPLALRYVSDAKQARMGSALALLSCGALILSRSAVEIAVCAFFAGLGLSTLYPIAVTLLSSSFGSKAAHIGGTMFALSTLGGATVPWLVGFTSTQSHSLRTALVVPFLGCALMVFLFSRPRWRCLE